MRFNHLLIQILRWLLLPFACLYGLIVWLRNKLYDWRVFTSTQFDIPTICIGNLSVGGTGKTPMTEYLIRLLSSKYIVATLSRGYGRKTKGFVLADHTASPETIGDEPYQLFAKQKMRITVAVDENRVEGIEKLKQIHPKPEIILLDDAFQHRAVRAKCNILLTDYHHLFTEDFYLPSGNLRDLKSAYKRAQAIVITKSPAALTPQKAAEISQKIQLQEGQEIFFSTIEYGNPYHLNTNKTIILSKDIQVLLVTGIANPVPLQQYITQESSLANTIEFPDHHDFSEKDAYLVLQRLKTIKNDKKIIITTEKDAVKLSRLKSFSDQSIPIYTIPIQTKILFGQSTLFEQMILSNIQ